jgi:septum formation protein
MKLILASGSKQRRDIFDMLGIKYDILTSNEEEKSEEKDPSKYVMELSKIKANSVKKQIDEKAIIIGCDTIINLGNKIIEKPKTKEHAIKMMKEIQGNETIAITGVTIIDLYQNKEVTFNDKTVVTFNKMTDDEILWYVNNESTIHNVCGYALLGKACLFLEKVDGDYNTLFGISPNKIYKELKKLGYSLNDFELKDN